MIMYLQSDRIIYFYILINFYIGIILNINEKTESFRRLNNLYVFFQMAFTHL